MPTQDKYDLCFAEVTIEIKMTCFFNSWCCKFAIGKTVPVAVVNVHRAVIKLRRLRTALTYRRTSM